MIMRDDDKKHIIRAIDVLLESPDPYNTSLPTRICLTNHNEIICDIGNGLTLGFCKLEKTNQLEFIALYRQ